MDNRWIDRPTEIRKGEELDESKLEAYLRNELELSADPLEILQFSNGFSNLTFLVKCGDQEFVLRRPPFGANIKSGHSMLREYKILSALEGSYKKVPKPVLYTADESIIGSEFYLMDRMKGVILRAKMEKEMIPSPDQMHEISQGLVDTLAELHSIDYESIGLEELGRPLGYTNRQVAGWSKRFEAARTSQTPSIDLMAAWLQDHIPESQKSALIHNDFKYDNLILDPEDWTSVIGVLDWEMSTLGDPLMDLGTTLGYWINHDDPDWMKALSMSPTTIPGNPTRSEVVQMYAKQRSIDESEMVFYYVYGLFKIAGITQQIYARYEKGLTNDKRFASLNKVVDCLGMIGSQAIKKERLDNLF